MSLPPGWTRHIAPSGHYYYHAQETGASTYERPQWTKGREQEEVVRKRVVVADRAVRTKLIPHAEPWLLVLTRQGRKFVHHPGSQISLWLPTQEVQQALEAMAPVEKAFSDGEGASESESESGSGSVRESMQEVGFDEEDIAWQLEQMADVPPDVDEPTLGEKRSVFEEMLAERNISPYNTWDMHMDALVSDPRYLALNTTKERRLVYDEWSKRQIAKIQETKHLQPKQDRRLDFLLYIIQHASPKLFWPEFRRRHKKQPAIDKWVVPDREKESLYRQVVGKRKQSLEQQLEDARDADRSDVEFLILPKEQQLLLHAIPGPTS